MLPAIRVENLSKEYRLGQSAGYRTLRESVSQAATRAWRRLGRRPPIGHPSSGISHPSSASSHPPSVIRHSSSDAAADRLWALRDVSFDVQPGEVVGIIGRNGAGKSTLLKILSRITEPTHGRVTLRGRVGSLLEVGTGFHPELTGRENIYMNGAILGMTRREIDRKFDEIVDFAEIEQFLDTPVKRYSSGMYVRLAFAVAAHLEPEILIVDEVLAVGDVEFQKKCLGKMGEVSCAGRTILFVSHNLAALKSLCRKAILFDRGRTLTSGNTSAVIDAYLAMSLTIGHSGSVPDNARRIGTGEARVRRVRLVSDASQGKLELCLGEPIRVAIEFEVLKPIMDTHFSVNIDTLDGTTLTCCQTTDWCDPGVSFCRGTYTVEAALDVTLLPGNYAIGVGLHHESGLSIDFVERTINFSVLRVAFDHRSPYRWSRVIGHIRPNVKWTLPFVSGSFSETM